ncbi:hypothetical protein CHH58_15835 [Terribacillus saccharophilus]|uniref:ABC-three component system protein n=1 Tax=Terribacillus saccharophilus TaxID=361277 RepID=UPI000BA5178C|nr:ABC-three component system protein [Terribacillus saccharophilus]PAF35685.1 hypothetical protein CHH58_15835 [Terribacillus saccharophilus]
MGNVEATSNKIKENQYTTDASPSWNGYNHQGKVGIYVVLKMIEKIKKEDHSRYELELEWFEDFSIKKDDLYQSIHQVKTYSDTAISKYKDAIWLLLAKLLDFTHISNAYLHVTQSLTNSENIRGRLLELDPPTVVSKDKDKEDDKKRTKSIYASPRECYDKVDASGKYEEVSKKFFLYNYNEDQNYCSMEDIEYLIKDQLKRLIKENVTEVRVDRAYHYLLGLVDKNIRQRHNNIQDKTRENIRVPIKFVEIQEIVENNFETVSKEYVSYHLKNDFNRITNCLIEDLEVDLEDGIIGIEEIENIRKLVNYTNQLSEEDFLVFCLKITPDNQVNMEIPDQIIKVIRECLHQTSLNDGFFEILKQVKRNIDPERLIYSKKNQDGINMNYLPSTIIEKFHRSRTARLANRIVNNAQPEMLNEVDNIITKHISLPFLEDPHVTSNVPDPDIEILDQNYHNRITKIKKISLIDLDTAKGELS